MTSKPNAPREWTLVSHFSVDHGDFVWAVKSDSKVGQGHAKCSELIVVREVTEQTPNATSVTKSFQVDDGYELPQFPHEQTPMGVDGAAEIDRSWFKDHGFIRDDKDEFKSTTTFQSVAKAAIKYGYRAGQNDPEVMSRFLHEQRMKQVEAELHAAKRELDYRKEDILKLEAEKSALEAKVSRLTSAIGGEIEIWKNGAGRPIEVFKAKNALIAIHRLITDFNSGSEGEG